jgi:hypothetical protein
MKISLDSKMRVRKYEYSSFSKNKRLAHRKKILFEDVKAEKNIVLGLPIP